MKLTVNGKELEAKSGETILTLLKREGIKVPTLCHMEDMLPSGACRLCVVEVEGAPGLVPSCSFPAAEGMKIHTNSPRVINARKTIIELLLGSHPDDCLYCAKQPSCDLSRLSREYGVTKRKFPVITRRRNLDVSSPSIVRDPEKCILCGKCVRVCEEVQGVACIDFIKRGSNTFIGCAFDSSLNVSSCINCGQCINVCPTGALMEKSSIQEVMDALSSGKHVVVQHAPAVSVSIAEDFGLPAGTDACGVMTAALRKMGFKAVFDTSFSADLTIMEEASELVERVKTGGVLPMMTSCSPGWIKFVETFYPEMIGNLSTCKSPQQMLGAMIKTYYAKNKGLKPAEIVSVSVMPCTAKKFEVDRPEMGRAGVPDMDFVLTTRELVRMIKLYGMDLKAMDPQEPDVPFGERTTAGKLFGATGGVMEAALRTAHFMLTGKELGVVKFEAIRGMAGIKEAKVKIGDLEVGVAVVSGLGNARKLVEQIKSGERKDLHFIEVMTCPGGCINGGGQPFARNKAAIAERMRALYTIDSTEKIRTSHSNKAVQQLYKEFLGKPLGEKSHHLLHTKYTKRKPSDMA